MKRTSAFVAVTVILSVGIWGAVRSTASAATLTPACQNIAQPQVPGAEVQSITGVEKPAGTIQIPGGPTIPVPAHCEVTIFLTHPGAGDHVMVAVWLPSSGWNGRFQGTGGGGYSAGLFGYSLAPAILQGYAAASTDAGVSPSPYGPPTWALNANGTVNTALLTNFAFRSEHDMTVAAKQIVTSFYGTGADRPHSRLVVT